ncbi:DUF4258 domain-containing protein [Blastochloris tepida]|uniref:Uncharacterized protein n=1 Tax=Blastochloris tepida TaxID=2233851 RepID=A0A348FYV2_9HYPH|nr:DUF4258 domain-containing protein [Blastochloris tepida]BBF92485.1 hypothetical protein BLTE_11700 [Blastochloris tepida]
MTNTLTRIRQLAAAGDVLISAHGYDELAADDILVADVLAGLETAVVVEDYPEAARGPTVLVRQMDSNHLPVHVVWGLPQPTLRPAVLATAYRPAPAKWLDDFTWRRR